MTNLTIREFFDKLSTISTALELKLIKEDDYPHLRASLIALVADCYIDWLTNMAYSELKSRVVNCEHAPIKNWSLVELVDDFIYYYRDTFEEDDYIFKDDGSTLASLVKEVSQMFSPIEWAKINSGIVNAQREKER